MFKNGTGLPKLNRVFKRGNCGTSLESTPGQSVRYPPNSWNTISVQNVKNSKITILSSNTINYMFSEGLETTNSDFVTH